MLGVATIQYCARDGAEATLPCIRPMTTKAAQKAHLVRLTEVATFLSASRSQLAECAEWEDDSFSHQK